MSQDPWNEWSDAWQDTPPAPTAEIDAIERRIRRRLFWRSAQAAADIAACVFALALCAWVLLTRDDAVSRSTGAIGLAFSLFGLFVVLAARRPPGAMADRSVASALDWEILEIDSDIRRSWGGLVMAAAGLVFLAAIVAIAFEAHRLPRAVWGLPAAGFVSILGSVAWSGGLLVRRKARKRRLRALRDELIDD
ncbi:hypothetical protein [Caulobacter sp.]|uniref:hypothetical protein n=1 Tax=Caulobacter sp. TaxID=78 RepID=UPI001B2C54ED|nr:hypothetical protein [Caulobacter sp.]MBO9543067.1 hypothetical protein [Caulobacter sp.]